MQRHSTHCVDGNDDRRRNHDNPTVDRRADRTDRGFSYIEVTIAIVLLGIIVIAMIEAVRASASASAMSRAASQIETAVVNAADRVNRAPVGCDYTIYAQAAVQTQGWDPALATVVQEYYVPGASPSTAGTWTTGVPGAPACPGPTAPDLVVQRVTITMRSPDRDGLERSIQVVKSDV